MGTLRFVALQTRPTVLLGGTAAQSRSFSRGCRPLRPRSRSIEPHGALMGSSVRPADTPSTGTVYSVNCPLFLRSAGLSRPRT
jgi:hypothetical protein